MLMANTVEAAKDATALAEWKLRILPLKKIKWVPYVCCDLFHMRFLSETADIRVAFTLDKFPRPQRRISEVLVINGECSSQSPCGFSRR